VAYAVELTGAARRALGRIPPRVAPAIVEFLFGDLARQPHRVGNPLERELVGFFGARRGPYRVLYRIDDEAQRVYAIHVDHCGDVYRPR
jgi:mRNA-degrading endonuclease RelE of RelBE toxin-antitoxin system